MGINISANSRLNFFFYINLSFFKANMNLTVFAGILLAVTTVTARRASLVEKIKRAAAEAEEPDEAKRESAMTECSFRYCTVATDGPSSECCKGEKNGPLRGRWQRCIPFEDGGWKGFVCEPI